MSRSKRDAGGATPIAQPARRRGILRSDSGALRGGWVLALAALVWAAAELGLRLGLTAAFDRLFAAWGIDASNAYLAPWWARWVYAWHGSAVTAAQALAMLLLALGLRRLLRLPKPGWESPGRFGRGLGIGLGAAVALAAVFLLADSLRAAWPLYRPRFSAGLLALLAIGLLSALAGETLTKRVVYDTLRPRWGAGWTSLAVALLFFLGSGGYAGGVIAGLNTLLLGALCCALYGRRGSLWGIVGLRWGWSAANLFLLGFGGGEQSLYRLYGVSERALTGGDAGLMYGLGATILLLTGLAWLERARLAALARRLRAGKRA